MDAYYRRKIEKRYFSKINIQKWYIKPCSFSHTMLMYSRFKEEEEGKKEVEKNNGGPYAYD